MLTVQAEEQPAKSDRKKGMGSKDTTVVRSRLNSSVLLKLEGPKT